MGDDASRHAVRAARVEAHVFACWPRPSWLAMHGPPQPTSACRPRDVSQKGDSHSNGSASTSRAGGSTRAATIQRQPLGWVRVAQAIPASYSRPDRWEQNQGGKEDKRANVQVGQSGKRCTQQGRQRTCARTHALTRQRPELHQGRPARPVGWRHLQGRMRATNLHQACRCTQRSEAQRRQVSTLLMAHPHCPSPPSRRIE